MRCGRAPHPLAAASARATLVRAGRSAKITRPAQERRTDTACALATHHVFKVWHALYLSTQGGAGVWDDRGALGGRPRPAEGVCGRKNVEGAMTRCVGSCAWDPVQCPTRSRLDGPNVAAPRRGRQRAAAVARAPPAAKGAPGPASSQAPQRACSLMNQGPALGAHGQLYMWGESPPSSRIRLAVEGAEAWQSQGAERRGCLQRVDQVRRVRG